MATQTQTTEKRLDFRVYIGILFFRWQIIVVCFLYCLLGAVLYIQFTPKRYQTYCHITMYRDPNLSLTDTQAHWTSLNIHRVLMNDGRLKSEVAASLVERWGQSVPPQKRIPHVNVYQGSGSLSPVMDVILETENATYARAFLDALVAKHEVEWRNIQRQSTDAATKMLEQELAMLEEKVAAAQQEVIDFERLHDLARVSARGSVEQGYINALVGRRHQLSTELLMMEYTTPELRDLSIGVISAVDEITRQTGEIKPEGMNAEDRKAMEKAEQDLPDDTKVKEQPRKDSDETLGYPALRVELARLRQREKDMLSNLKPEHPSVKAIRAQIGGIENQFDVMAQVKLESLRDRYRALELALKAVEAAEYRWQARDFLNRQRMSEYRRLQSRVERFEGNYGTLQSRLHDVRIEQELKAEHFSVQGRAASHARPVWPNAGKILLVALTLGLGSGLGLALVSQVMDNKLQSIADVEQELGVTFLGGIPFWVHSGLERVIRPIVTEEHSSGAIEAYRALRTNIVAALGKTNDKILLVTSADSREGKTLTALNLAIMIAQMDKKVLLVDLDIRRGRLHRSLGMEKEPGMTDILDDRLSLRQVAQPTRIENLQLVPTGRTIENAAELLEASDLVALFDAVEDQYDYIIADTSPVLRVTDTVIIARQGVGPLLYIARVNHTPKPLVRYSLDMLRDVNVIGLVMNSIEMHKISSLYYTYQYPNYAYYSNAYAYGYDYYYSEGTRGRRRSRMVKGRLRQAMKKVRENLMPFE